MCLVPDTIFSNLMKRALPFLLGAFTSLLLVFCGTTPGSRTTVASSPNIQATAASPLNSQTIAKGKRLILFPFTGGNSADGVSIVSGLTRQQVFLDVFNDVTLVTQNTIDAMNFAKRFQQNSGIIDTDTIFELGKELKASNAITGYITRLGEQNLVIVSLMDVESLMQIAGDYRTYNTIDEISVLIPDIAKNLAAAVTRDTGDLPGLSVPPFNISGDVNQNDSMALTQILLCDLANFGSYAVLPRADKELNKIPGKGRAADFVLDGHVELRGPNLTKFATDVYYRDGRFKEGFKEEYTDFSQGFLLMPKLAAKLSGAGGVGLPVGFVRVEGGTFQMGSDNGALDEKPIHSVTVKSFSMAKYPVTQKEWSEVMGTTVRQQRDMADKSWALIGEGDNYPMYYVSWNEAVEYCNKRSLMEGLTPAYEDSGNAIACDWNANGYRLPTEAEWEYAAKGGNKDDTVFEYSGSNNVDAVGWYKGNSGGNTHPVGMKAPNSLGLYDMSGNVWEWCWDRYGGYSNSAQNDPRGASSGSSRVLRGGSWLNDAKDFRSACRNGDKPSYRYNDIGFRLVRN